MSDPYNVDIGNLFYKNTGQQIGKVVDDLYQSTPFGSIDRAIGNNAYGINHRKTPPSIGLNRDDYGLTFFTRPAMNLSTPNVRDIRQFTPMLTNVANSWPRIIRGYLDPSLAAPLQTGLAPVTSEFVDPQQAFIPLLTNLSLGSTGWPDIEAPTFASHEGIYKESYSFVDGSTALYGTYDITATFRNIPGDPIMLMILMWVLYASHVYLGDIIPYPRYLIKNEIDYTTRIYRLVLDSSRRFVTKIACTGASFPTGVPYGSAINHDADHPLNMNNVQISIPFRSIGVWYNDPIIVDEFNRTVAAFNVLMDPKRFTMTLDKATGLYKTTHASYKQVPLEALQLFNYRGYARINPITMELEWWVDQAEYNYRLPASQ